MARRQDEVTRRSAIAEVAPLLSIERRSVTKADSFSSFYTNDIEIQTSTWDIRMLISELGDLEVSGDEHVLSVKRLAEIRMSPQLAKRLTLILADQLKSYEARFGSIPTNVSS